MVLSEMIRLTASREGTSSLSLHKQNNQTWSPENFPEFHPILYAFLFIIIIIISKFTRIASQNQMCNLIEINYPDFL